jgi:putative glycerol-1-phosphate prenyltransferase
MDKQLYNSLFRANKKMLAVVIDPDSKEEEICNMVEECNANRIDLILLGGSLVTEGSADSAARIIKENSSIPVVLFPGSEIQLTKKADALLLLSLISGRNPELLIGKHVVSAPYIKRSGMETIPTGYILIDGGRPTSVTYMSNTFPIPADKADIAMATAMAGELLGMKLIFLDAGSGALKHVSTKMINKVRKAIDLPIIVGGGINNPQDLENIYTAGANVVVIGTSVEKDNSILTKMVQARDKVNSLVAVS